MLEQVLELLEQEPVIAAVKDDEGLRGCLAHGGHVTFVLYGSVTTAAQIVRTLKESGRTVFLDVDLVEGLSAREAACLLYTSHWIIEMSEMIATANAKSIEAVSYTHLSVLLDNAQTEKSIACGRNASNGMNF